MATLKREESEARDSMEERFKSAEKKRWASRSTYQSLRIAKLSFLSTTIEWHQKERERITALNRHIKLLFRERDVNTFKSPKICGQVIATAYPADIANRAKEDRTNGNRADKKREGENDHVQDRTPTTNSQPSTRLEDRIDRFFDQSRVRTILPVRGFFSSLVEGRTIADVAKGVSCSAPGKSCVHFSRLSRFVVWYEGVMPCNRLCSARRASVNGGYFASNGGRDLFEGGISSIGVAIEGTFTPAGSFRRGLFTRARRGGRG